MSFDFSTTKSPLASRTVWGLVIAALPTLLGVFGIEMTPEDATGIVGQIDVIVTACGVLLGYWGRYSATRPISLL